MMGSAFKITGVSDFLREAKAELREFEKDCAAEMERAAWVTLEAFFSWTPVWEGQVIRSYTVSVGAPQITSREPLGQGPPGPTNSMALGDEPRRAANEAAVRSEASAALRRLQKLETVWITNGSSLWDLVDAGGAPGGKGQVTRNPGGTSKLAEQLARSRLEHFK